MKQNINHKDIRAADDSEELIGILTAISVVSKRLARKLTAASYQSNYKAEYECPLRQERRNHASLRDQCGNHAAHGRNRL